MATAEQLAQNKQDWRQLLTKSIAKALEAMEEQVPVFSPKYKLLVNLRARLNEANQGRMAGTLSNEQLQLEYNRIRMSLLETIDALTIDDFRPQSMAQPPSQRKTGYLLHKIPPQMKVGKEEECIIRLAYEQAAIVQDIELSEAVEVKQVTVSKIMQAELIDPNEEPAFAIRTFSDEEQFLQEGEYTEWKFWVKPLREGTFALLLKVSVVEVVEGKERARNLTWEEKIQIITEETQLEPAFRESGISFAAYQQKGAAPPLDDMEEPPPIPRRISSEPKKVFNQLDKMIDPAYSPPPAPPPKRAAPRLRANIRRLSVAATVLIAIGVVLFQLPLFMGTDSPTDTESREPSGVIDKGDKPGSEVPADTTGLFPKEEEALWELAKERNEDRYYRQYLEQFPEGKHAEKARKALQ